MNLFHLAVLYVVKAWQKAHRSLNVFNNIYAKAYLQYKKACYQRDIQFYGFPRLRFGEGCDVKIGKGFICRSAGNTSLDDITSSYMVVHSGAQLHIGNNSGISDTVIVCTTSITIGYYVNIGNGTIIIDSDMHHLDWQTRIDRESDRQGLNNQPVTIGNHVFIGMRTIILKGVTIGDKSVVAAGSVVCRDIPPCEMWGGNPAHFIKKIGS